MTNIEKYNNLFCESFQLQPDEIENAEYKVTELWDSVGHMILASNIEEMFEIELDPDDILDFTSYSKGLTILTNKYNIIF
ncbi:MAG: acyl carrier protein [Paludibacteraceae bacterium]|nr:acyl carrier protein [Paludibacteraceae bacterium]